MGNRLVINEGEQYNQLTVMKEVAPRRTNNGNLRVFLCKCSCGVEKEILLGALRSGKIKGCGCMRGRHANRYSVHGQWDKPVYGAWRDMIQRCTNPNNAQFKNYGDRGISVCEEWMTAKNFIDWAFRNGYDDSLSIDRIDVNGNYNPENCRWVSMQVQHSNKRSNIVIEYKGVKRTLRQWSKITGVNHETLRRRLKDGWDTERALFGKSQRGKKYHD